MARTMTRDMTVGSIPKQLLGFALPLMVGNIFQMLYNTVDSIVVGNFVGTQALAAVSATTMLTNMAVFFFNSFSIGASVIIGQFFGGKKHDRLHAAVETTMASTLILCVLFTVGFLATTQYMLEFMDTPADVFKEADVYLKIYFEGVAGLLLYNIGSGILRAVGDTKRPLYFLILTSILNIFLDLLFVVTFHMGIAGAAYATILSQFISAGATVFVLMHTKDVYRFNLKDMCLDKDILKGIFRIGMPTALQSVITSLSNVFVQAYINFFGAAVMAGWGCYNKIDQFVLLIMQSMAMASTTFVAQNIGAYQEKRANQGTFQAVMITLLINACVSAVLAIYSNDAMRMFSGDEAVIHWGTIFIRQNIFFLLFNCVNHVLAGALRGRGDSVGPMLIMLVAFVAIRQTYLFFMTRFIANTPQTVGFGYPLGWASCCIMEILYFHLHWKHRSAIPEA